MIELQPVTYKDMAYLYDLLRERTPEMSISHVVLPSWDEHVKFWDTCDYKEAFIITHYGQQRGLVYLTRDYEIGIFINIGHKFTGIGTETLRLMLNRHEGRKFLANINPENQDSIDFFLRKGFKHIQNTYEFINV